MRDALLERFTVRIELDGHALINFGDLLSEIAAAGMNDQITAPRLRFIDFNEMIAAAQGADAARDPVQPFQFFIAIQPREIEFGLFLVPDVHARRHEMRRFVECFKINRLPTKVHGVHPATDIDADHVGHGLVDNRHRRPNRAALPGVNVRHDAHAAPRRHVVAAHPPYLLARFRIDGFRKRNRRRHRPFNRFHPSPLLFLHPNEFGNSIQEGNGMEKAKKVRDGK